jgi:hypothetical protein
MWKSTATTVAPAAAYTQYDRLSLAYLCDSLSRQQPAAAMCCVVPAQERGGSQANLLELPRRSLTVFDWPCCSSRLTHCRAVLQAPLPHSRAARPAVKH